MDGQTMFNFILGALFTINCSLIGIIYSSISSRLSKVEEKSNLLEVLVNGKYMTREEALSNNHEVLNKLEEIQKDINACRLEHHRRRGDDVTNPI